jgi:hypothetical protein
MGTWDGCQPGSLKGTESTGLSAELYWKVAVCTNPGAGGNPSDVIKTGVDMAWVTGMKLSVVPGYAGWIGTDGTKALEGGRPFAGETPFEGTTDARRA